MINFTLSKSEAQVFIPNPPQLLARSFIPRLLFRDGFLVSQLNLFMKTTSQSLKYFVEFLLASSLVPAPSLLAFFPLCLPGSQVRVFGNDVRVAGYFGKNLVNSSFFLPIFLVTACLSFYIFLPCFFWLWFWSPSGWPFQSY